MKKFKGDKPLSIIKRAVQKNGWPWNQEKYDQGGDWLSFGFVHEGQRFDILYNTFNGSFLAKPHDGTEMISERADNMDDVPWYAALLDFIYEPADSKAA